jgi:nucleotide-binding universal stress UspA family protein
MAGPSRVAAGVLSRTDIPVLLFRPTDHRFARLNQILAPLDGSVGSLAGLAIAARLARAARAAVVLLQVVEPLPLWLYDPTLGLDTGPLIDPRWNEDRRAHAETYVKQIAARLAQAGIEVGADALLGDVAATIAEYAACEAVDLIVMATHARSGPLKKLLGSVADKLVRTGPCPVLLVRR